MTELNAQENELKMFLLQAALEMAEESTPPWEELADINSPDDEQEYGIVLNAIFMQEGQPLAA